jgi:hypothetical protein
VCSQPWQPTDGPPITVSGLPAEVPTVEQRCKDPGFTTAEQWASFFGLNIGGSDEDYLVHEWMCWDYTLDQNVTEFCVTEIEDEVTSQWGFCFGGCPVTLTQPGFYCLASQLENPQRTTVYTRDDGTTILLDANAKETTNVLVWVYVSESPVERIPNCIELLEEAPPDEHWRATTTKPILGILGLEVQYHNYTKHYLGTKLGFLASANANCESPVSISTLTSYRGTQFVNRDTSGGLQFEGVDLTVGALDVVEVSVHFTRPSPPEPINVVGRTWTLPAKENKFGLLQLFKPIRYFLVTDRVETYETFLSDQGVWSELLLTSVDEIRNIACEWGEDEDIRPVNNYSGGQIQLQRIKELPVPICDTNQNSAN